MPSVLPNDHGDVSATSTAGDPAGGDDALFDMLYPDAIRALSRRHWTPVDVARRAAVLFQEAGVGTVLDVGAGVGKFVVVAARTAPDVHFVGVEQRDRLVDVARLLAKRIAVTNASFVMGNAMDLPWAAFDGFYFFNPFAESLFNRWDRIDDRSDMTRERFVHDVLCVESKLRACRIGSAVVTYHGMGGRMPGCFELLRELRVGSDWLRLWFKRWETDDGSFFVELDDRVLPCSASSPLHRLHPCAKHALMSGRS